jgi:hypothetical protein
MAFSTPLAHIFERLREPEEADAAARLALFCVMSPANLSSNVTTLRDQLDAAGQDPVLLRALVLSIIVEREIFGTELPQAPIGHKGTSNWKNPPGSN